MFISVDNARLKGYHHGCQSLQGIQHEDPPAMLTPYERAEACRRNGFRVSMIKHHDFNMHVETSHYGPLIRVYHLLKIMKLLHKLG